MNPRCVIVCVSAFGSDGPDAEPARLRPDRPGAVRACCSPTRGRATPCPRRTGGLALADFTAGLLAALSVTAGLLGRDERARRRWRCRCSAPRSRSRRSASSRWTASTTRRAGRQSFAGRAELEARRPGGGRRGARPLLPRARVRGRLRGARLPQRWRSACACASCSACEDPFVDNPQAAPGGRGRARAARGARARGRGRVRAARASREAVDALARAARPGERGARPRPAVRRRAGARERAGPDGRAAGGRARCGCSAASFKVDGVRPRPRPAPPLDEHAGELLGAPEPLMRVVTDLPRPVRVIDHVWIPLSDGIRLGAPDLAPRGRRGRSRCRRSSSTSRTARATARPRATSRATPTSPGHGYAVLRVDLRGSGESGGLLHDEYLPQEQEDALEVLRWIAAQPWCTGDVGMFGISWGGFNGLQVAAHAPPELKAVISLCSTDDRYADDVHYRGGSVLALEMLSWGASMLSVQRDRARPGGRRAGAGASCGSSASTASSPTSTSGSATSAATTTGSRARCARTTRRSSARSTRSAAGRTATRRRCSGSWQGLRRTVEGAARPVVARLPRRGRAGPGDRLPPGVPALVGPVAEGRGHRDRRTSRSCARGCRSRSPRRRATCERPGRWVAEAQLAVAGRSRSAGCGSATDVLREAPDRRGRRGSRSAPTSSAGSTAASGAPTGPAARARSTSAPTTAARSASTPPRSTERIELLGNARVELELESDRPVAQLAARLCDVAPDGTSLLVTRGVLNLTHRDSHEHPAPLEPGERTRVVARARRHRPGDPGRPPASAGALAGVLAVAVAGAGAGHARRSTRRRARSSLPVRPPRPEDERAASVRRARAGAAARGGEARARRGLAHASTRDFASGPHRAHLRLGRRRPLPARRRRARGRLLDDHDLLDRARRPALGRGALRRPPRSSAATAGSPAPRSAR